MRALALYGNTKVVMINGKKLELIINQNGPQLILLVVFIIFLNKMATFFGIKIRIS